MLQLDEMSGADLDAFLSRSPMWCRKWFHVVDWSDRVNSMLFSSILFIKTEMEPTCEQITVQESEQNIQSTSWRKVTPSSR